MVETPGTDHAKVAPAAAGNSVEGSGWGRRLAIAAVASLVVHLLISAWRGPALPDDQPEPPPLRAELTRIPSPPPASHPPAPQIEPASTPTPKPLPRRTARPRPKPSPSAVHERRPAAIVPPSEVATELPPVEPPELVAPPALVAPPELVAPPAAVASARSPVGEPASGERADSGTLVGSGAEAASASVETPSSAAGLEGASALPGTPVTPSLTEALPPVVDLIYSAFLGSSTFVIGTVGYRFERDGDQYAIETLGRAQGIVALLFPGELRVRSRGRVSEKGLLPEELRVERGRADRIELARFDTVTETLELHDKPPQPLNPPTYDLLTFWLQFYFAPPAGDEVEFRVATTRQVRDYRLRRTAFETVATPLGEVRTQVWQRVGERADDADAVIWLAPLWNFLPVKVRLANRRGAVEQLLVGVRTGLVVPESMRDGPKLELPVDGEGRLVREEVPSERRHTP